MKNKFLLSLCLFSFFIVDTVHAFEIDRRREQFNKQYGQLFVPLPYSLPGLGTGLLFIGNFGNILDTTTDIAAIGGIGDAEFIFTFLDELFLAPDLLYLQYLRAHGFKFALQQYSSRGMNTSKNDFKYGIGNSWDLNAPTLKLTFMDRMLEIGLGINKQSGTFQKFVSPDENDPTKQGETVATFDPGLEINIAKITTESTPQLLGDELVERGMIGIIPILNHREAGLIESFSVGISQTYYFLNLTYRSLLALFKGNVSIKEMAGPIMIAKIAGETASAGLNALLGLMAFISINLGFINILPVPGLDGGHVVIALVEGIIRKDLPLKVKMGIQQAGLFLLLLLFITIMVNDIQRLFQ